MTVNLDKSRAARRESHGEGPKVVMDGKTYELAVELPYEVIEAMRGMANEMTAPSAVDDMARAILGEEAYTAFMAFKPSINDLYDLIDGLLTEYGVDSPLLFAAS